MVTQPYRYPLDPTGISPDNLVVGEQHTLVNRTVRAFAPLNGAFFTESVVLKDRSTNATLVKGVQYRATELYEFPTGRWGKEICGIILVTDPSVSNDVEIQYQALGGEYSTNMDAVIQMFNQAMLNRPVAWPDIYGKPDDFNPAAHFHDVGDIYGFEYVVNALERLRQAVLTGDVASHEEILKYVDNQDSTIRTDTQTTNTELSVHTGNFNNPHQTTKTQVGLGSVENYPVATQAEAVAGTANDRYMTPLRSKNAVDSATAPYTAHVNSTNNPHNVTKSQVGLGSVQNYDIATTAEAQTGNSNIKYMTPIRVKEAIDAISGTAITAHVSNTNNPHNTTKAQVGLGSVQNYDIATQAEAEAGVSNVKYMTPQRTAQAIATQATVAVNAHASRTDNPHQTTKTQVGLGNVENYPVATQSEAIAGVSSTSYMTPQRVNDRFLSHALSSAHDARYVRLNADSSCALRESGGQLHAFIGGGWRIVWPPQWDGGVIASGNASLAWNPDTVDISIIHEPATNFSAEASANFQPDGSIFYDGQLMNGPISYLTPVTSGAGNDYEISAIITSGSIDSGASLFLFDLQYNGTMPVGIQTSWYRLNTMRTISVVQFPPPGSGSAQTTITGTVYVRKIGTSTVYSKPFTLNVITNQD